MWQTMKKCIPIGLALPAVSCSDQTERNVITERPPFYQTTIPYKQRETDRIIASVQRYAETNDMDFLLARNSLPEGDYNATVAGRDLNFNVMHTQSISPETSDIYAISRAAPSEADQKKARQFYCVVAGKCSV
jgi:hypothetical protein